MNACLTPVGFKRDGGVDFAGKLFRFPCFKRQFTPSMGTIGARNRRTPLGVDNRLRRCDAFAQFHSGYNKLWLSTTAFGTVVTRWTPTPISTRSSGGPSGRSEIWKSSAREFTM